jgi:sec-independent protein translocase protein TatB
MLSLSPAKILVVVVVALLVLGPDKLPGVARQLGSLWGDLRRLRSKLESEVRGVFPDLPPTHELTQAVRSPLDLLNRLADEHERSLGSDGSSEATVEVATGDAAPADDLGTRGPPGTDVATAAGNGNGHDNGSRSAGDAGGGWPAGAGGASLSPEPMPSLPDDPSMN